MYYQNNKARKGIKDLWNSFMVEKALFSNNDIPICPTTATQIPTKLISFSNAKTIHYKEMKTNNKNYHIDAFIHFYIDDQKFDGKESSIWLYPDKAYKIIKHFSGIILPDFSTYLDFPDPLIKWNIYRMNAFGFWIQSKGIQVISNLRWGYEYTWKYCFDGNPHNSMLAIGTVASGLHLRKNRLIFEQGLNEAITRLHPHTLLIYGSANHELIKRLKNQGIKIITYESDTNIAFKKRGNNHV